MAVHKNLLVIVIVSSLVTACSSFKRKSQTAEGVPSEYTEYKKEDISLSTALFLSETSYRLGCVEAHKKFNQVSGANAYCLKKAKQSVRENIMHILNQPGTH